MFTQEEIELLRECLLEEERQLQHIPLVNANHQPFLLARLSTLRNVLNKLAVMENSIGELMT